MADDKDALIEQLRNQLAESKAQLRKTIENSEALQTQSKQLQEFLQTQGKKKDADIKKMKQDFSKKQKMFSQSKAKFAEYEKQINAKNKINTQLNQKLQKCNLQLNNNSLRTIKLQQNLQVAKKILNQKITQVQGLRTQNQQLKEIQSKLHKQLEEKNHSIQQIKKAKVGISSPLSPMSPKPLGTNDQIKKLKQQILKLKKKQTSPGDINTIKIQNQRLCNQIQYLQNQLQMMKNNNTLQKSKSRTMIQMIPQNEQYKKLERAYKQLKVKYNEATQQKRFLFKQIKQLQKKHNNPYDIHRDIMIKNQDFGQDKKKDKQNSFHVLIKTKKHYISPFLEIIGKNLKLLKQTKSGFQKSLGCYKFAVQQLSYDVNQIAQNIIQNINIQNWKQKQNSDTIIIHGQKRSSKKQIFINIINGIKQKLSKIIQQDQQIHFTVHLYKVKFDTDIPLIDKQYDTDNQQYTSIQSVLSHVIQLIQKNKEDPNLLKKIKPVVKSKSKQQIRFLQIHLNGTYRLEIITSNNFSGFRDSDSLSSSLNTLIYSHIPFQTSNKQKKYIILPINPIVQQYDNVKMSLLLVNQQHKMETKKQDYVFNQNTSTISPGKEDLMINENVKKKMQNIQKQNQQSSLKIKRLEQQCSFYKSRIQQFIVRIKIIISTQNKQNTYLKKSPITLTLQKLQRAMTMIIQKNFNNKILTYQKQKIYEIDNTYEQIKEGQDQKESIQEDHVF